MKREWQHIKNKEWNWIPEPLSVGEFIHLFGEKTYNRIIGYYRNDFDYVNDIIERNMFEVHYAETWDELVESILVHDFGEGIKHVMEFFDRDRYIRTIIGTNTIIKGDGEYIIIFD